MLGDFQKVRTLSGQGDSLDRDVNPQCFQWFYLLCSPSLGFTAEFADHMRKDHSQSSVPMRSSFPPPVAELSFLLAEITHSSPLWDSLVFLLPTPGHFVLSVSLLMNCYSSFLQVICTQVKKQQDITNEISSVSLSFRTLQCEAQLQEELLLAAASLCLSGHL